MSSFRAGAAVLAFAALVSGCAALGQFPPSNALIGEWMVEDVDNAGVMDRANLTVAFDETSRISGSAGCNRYTGAYSYDASTGAITVTPLGVTRMLCAPAVMNQERRLITSLQSVTSVETTGDGATVLKSATGRVLLRRRANAPTTAATKAKPPVATTTTAATLPPPPTTTTPNYPPSNTQYPLSGGPSTTTTYTPPYASAPPIAPTQVTATGEVYFLERIALPPGAIVRIQLRDTARADAPALMLAQQEFAAGTGGPYPFSISAPMNVVPANARLSVAAQIRSGNRLLFTTDTNYPVAVDVPTAPLRLRLVNANPSATTLPTPAPAPVAPAPVPPSTTITPAAPPPTQPVIVQPPAPTPPATTPAIVTGPTGPAPTAYRCGTETVRVALDATMAWMTTADGVVAVPRVNPSDDPFAQRMYSNNRVTFIHDQEGAGGGRVQFARGRAALLTCAKVG